MPVEYDYDRSLINLIYEKICCDDDFRGAVFCFFKTCHFK
jgi:hypothetical protein